MLSLVDCVLVTLKVNDDDVDRDDDYLPMETLHVVSQVESVQWFVKQVDYSLYTGLIDILIPDVLRPIPGVCT